MQCGAAPVLAKDRPGLVHFAWGDLQGLLPPPSLSEAVVLLISNVNSWQKQGREELASSVYPVSVSQTKWYPSLC